MKLRIMIIISIVLGSFYFFSASNSFHPSSQFQIQSNHWYQLAERIKMDVSQHQIEQARNTLDELSFSFSRSIILDKNLTLLGVRSLADTLSLMEQTLNSAIPNNQQIIDAAIKLEVSFDAIVHANQPLWKEYYNIIMTDFRYMEKSAKLNKEVFYNQAKGKLIQDFSIIKPALAVTKSPITMEELDSKISLIKSEKDVSKNSQEIPQLKNLFRAIFLGTEKDVVLLTRQISIQVTIIGMIGFILSILIYVSYRKFKYKKIN